MSKTSGKDQFVNLEETYPRQIAGKIYMVTLSGIYIQILIKYIIQTIVLERGKQRLSFRD